MGMLCTWLTVANGAVFVLLGLIVWAMSRHREIAMLLIPSAPGVAFMLLAVFVSLHRAGAVDLTAVLATSTGFTVAVIGFMVVAAGKS